MDRIRFPSTAAYLEALPSGVASYPDYLAKASIYRLSLDSKGVPNVTGALPDSLADLIQRPLPVNTWIPEVAGRAVMHAIYDTHFATDAVAFYEWVYRQNRALFASPLYKVLMMVVSPRMMLRGAESRWGAFHRGMGLKVHAEPRGGTLRLSFPIGMLAELDIRAHGAVFQAAIDAAGARQSRVDLIERSANYAVYRGAWES